VFERYNAEAVRSLFFARKAVSDHGGTEIKPAHLIIGVLTAHPEAVLRFASANVFVDDMLQRLVAIVTEETRVPMTFEVRFSQESKAALERAQIEADELSDATIRLAHLILGIAVKTSGQATAALTDAGVRIAAIREALACRGGV
jgi:ATP-dependent Clp protease ATP-binding subunit ClpA